MVAPVQQRNIGYIRRLACAELNPTYMLRSGDTYKNLMFLHTSLLYTERVLESHSILRSVRCV